MAITELSCIFVTMNDKDRELIKRLLNRDKTVEDDILSLCDYSINHFIFHYYDDYADKTTLKQVLARELYYYFINKNLLCKFEGKNGCRLSTYLNSIAKNVLPRIKLEDSLIIKTKEKRAEENEKLENEIRLFDNEPENFHAFKSTPIPTEFRDEESFDDDYFYVGIDNDEEDIIMDIGDFKESLIDNTNNSTKELVRQTLDQLPPKEAYILRKQFYEGYDAKELAKELGHTVNVIYNLKSKAMRDFETIYKKLKNGLL